MKKYEKICSSNWILSPIYRGENSKKSLKPPTNPSISAPAKLRCYSTCNESKGLGWSPRLSLLQLRGQKVYPPVSLQSVHVEDSLPPFHLNFLGLGKKKHPHPLFLLKPKNEIILWRKIKTLEVVNIKTLFFKLIFFFKDEKDDSIDSPGSTDFKKLPSTSASDTTGPADAPGVSRINSCRRCSKAFGEPMVWRKIHFKRFTLESSRPGVPPACALTVWLVCWGILFVTSQGYSWGWRTISWVMHSLGDENKP